ncbi:MAG: hypothetical protein ACYTF7_06095 [Planctomycetota bacterium]|jgi:hypothetical protein
MWGYVFGFAAVYASIAYVAPIVSFVIALVTTPLSRGGMVVEFVLSALTILLGIGVALYGLALAREQTMIQVSYVMFAVPLLFSLLNDMWRMTAAVLGESLTAHEVKDPNVHHDDEMSIPGEFGNFVGDMLGILVLPFVMLDGLVLV